LTDRQRQVLDLIRAGNGYPPSVREIARKMGTRSANGMMVHLRALERKGYILREQFASRAIMLVRPERFFPDVDGQPAVPMRQSELAPMMDLDGETHGVYKMIDGKCGIPHIREGDILLTERGFTHLRRPISLGAIKARSLAVIRVLP
jgi:hypothetical protein